MVGLANLYLIGFAVDAVVSCVDDGLGVLGVASPLAAARTFIGLAVLLASAPVPFLLLFVPHLPKSVFFPPLAFVLVYLLAAGSVPVPDAAFSVAQAVVAATSFLLVKAHTTRWLLSADRLPYKRHLVARTAFATVVALVVVPFGAAALVVLGLVAGLEHETAGWLDLTASGIEVRESVLEKDGRTVVLTAMMHYGEEDFYRSLVDGLPPGSLVLAEGITDRGKRLSAFPSALKIAKALGLTQQPTPAAIRSRASGAAPAETAGTAEPAKDTGAHPDVVRADVDAAEFSDTTVSVLHDLAGLYSGDAPTEALRRLIGRARTGDDLSVFKQEVVDERNAHLLSVFDEKAAGYRTVMIPWGALHMPGIEAGLLERGYRVQSERKRAVVRFATVAEWLGG
jgi:hypothetical protein